MSPKLSSYYDKGLSAERLARCYELAPPRIKQYLTEELGFVRSQIEPQYSILELGCGYGRALKVLADKARLAFGIDTSFASIQYGQVYLSGMDNVLLAQMDASRLGFPDHSFNCVFCIQNGICAFNVNPQYLITEAVRVTRKRGKVLFSSYSDRIWDDRVEWFRIQSDEGLIGPLDYGQTKDGFIVSKDGFRAGNASPSELLKYAESIPGRIHICEIDESSVFLLLEVL